MKKGGKLILLLVLLTKSTKLVKVFKVLKLLKFTKALVTFFSMALSMLVYSFMLGPWFAFGFVLLLFIHEMGHVIAMRIKGLPTPGPVFIPMLGAVIFAPNLGEPEDEAFVGYGGPLLGGLAALAVFGIWALQGTSEVLLLVSYTAALINLFNMIPIRPLDGGRVTQVIGEWFKYVGFIGLLLFTLYIRQPAILLIWILVIQDIKLSAWLKFWIGLVCEIAMVILMVAGFSDQPHLVDILDILLASFFNGMALLNAKEANNITSNNATSKVINISIKVRMKWFFLYLALLIGLVVLMIYQMPYLPKTR